MCTSTSSTSSSSSVSSKILRFSESQVVSCSNRMSAKRVGATSVHPLGEARLFRGLPIRKCRGQLAVFSGREDDEADEDIDVDKVEKTTPKPPASFASVQLPRGSTNSAVALEADVESDGA